LGTHRDIAGLEQPKASRPTRVKDIAREIVETLNHRSWLMLFFSGVVFSIYIGLIQGLGIYFNRFFWEWAPSDVAIFAIADLAVAMLISVFAGTLAHGWDKKHLAIRLFVIAIVIGPVLLILRLADVWYGIEILPPNGEQYGPLWWVMLIHSMVVAGVAVMAFILVGSMTADVVEDSQRKTGKRAEGLFFAGPNLVQKAISGLGFVIKGSILTAVGFSTATTDPEKAAAVVNLAAVFVVLGVLLPSISLWVFSRYEITKDTHDTNLEALGYAGLDAETEDFPGRV
jgi:Na+/melibiose symporter-like transporter